MGKVCTGIRNKLQKMMWFNIMMCSSSQPRVALRVAALLLLVETVSSQDPFACNFLTDSGLTCMLPWPDNFFFAPTWNASAPRALVLQNSSLPLDGEGVGIDPVAGGWNELDGFSPLGPILAYFPGVNMGWSGLPRLWNISASCSDVATATSVLLDASTGTCIDHWVELDNSGDGSAFGAEQSMIIWPALRLEDSTRYIVAFRNLVDDSGLSLLPSDGFGAIRDGIPSSNPALEGSRPRFKSIFATLTSVGWETPALTLAWDFTTLSRDSMTSRMLHMRDDAFARIADMPGGVPYNITSVEDNVNVNTTRRIHGQFYVPCYLPYDAIPALDSHLILDPITGLPVYQNLVPFDFEVVIPPALAQRVAAGGTPGKVVTYGHGLFGDHGEVEESYLSSQAQVNGWVVAATDWIGLSEYDEATVTIMLLTGFTPFRIVPDRLHQGMLNTLVLNRLLTQSNFRSDASMTYGGNPVVSTDPQDWHYTGNSQGGIMGGVYMAVSTDVTSGVLGVAGGPYALLLPRSTDFAVLFDVLKARYARSMDRMGVLALIQALWDRMDPSGWASYISNPSNPLPGTPQHRAIWHYGLGDAQVSWLGAHAIARSAGAVMFESQVRDGNETLDYFPKVPDTGVLTSGNAIIGFDYGFPIVPFTNTPPSDGIDAHECPRRTASAQAQMGHFFATGEIINTCGGPCTQPHPDGCGN